MSLLGVQDQSIYSSAATVTRCAGPQWHSTDGGKGWKLGTLPLPKLLCAWCP